MLEAVQLSDVIGIDILGSLSKGYIQTVVSAFPQASSSLVDLAPEITIHFISSSLEAAYATPGGPGLRFVPTTTYSSCPLDLDILLIGGPLPSHRPPAATKLLQDIVSKGNNNTVIMSVCTGGMWVADSGVLKGKKATAQREVLGFLKVQHPEVEWLDRRWVVDGNFWTAGGAGCGVDMVIAYIKEKFDPNLVGLVLNGLQLGSDQGQFYKDEKPSI